MDMIRAFAKKKPDDKGKEKKGSADISEIPGDTVDAFRRWRALNPKALQDIEIGQMAAIHAIYQREIMPQIPNELAIEDDKKKFLLFTFDFKRAKLNVTDLDFDKKKSFGLMKDKDGPLKFQSEEIIGIICRFQEIKKKRSTNKGVNTDPENLFCEEVKSWCIGDLCLRPIDEDAKGVLYKRIRYFEEILCANNLFDRPSSRITHTVQQVIVACRGVLKYHTMPVIDKELAHHDARKAFDKLKQHFVTIIADTVELLFNVFRETPKKKGTEDTALKLLSLILEDPNIEEAFPDNQKEVRAKVLGQPEDWDNQRVKQKDFLKLGPNNSIFLTESVILDEKQAGGIPLASNKEPIKDANLARIFVGENSGFEARFRGNHFVARQFLRAHALVFEMGSFFVVLQKAAACASQGGTLLVYGLANAQLNAMLDTAEKLLQSLRDSLNLLASISEIRFEELVYANEATVSRSPWIAHFKVVHSTLAKIDEMMKKVSGEISSMKIHANSMTLYDQFQKAQDDTTAFLTLADGFSQNMSGILGIPYQKPKSPPIVNLPSQKSLDQLSEKEVGPGSEGINVMDLSKCVTVNY